MAFTYKDTLNALSYEMGSRDIANDAIDAIDAEVLHDLTFTDALFSGKTFIRVPYDQLQGRNGYAVFNTKTDLITDLTGLHDYEFAKDAWSASEDESFGEA